MKKAKVTQKDILYLSISVFAIVVAWIGFNLYHTWVTTKISEEIQAQVIPPIDPSFDTATVDELRTRQKVVPLTELSASSKSAAIQPTPTIEQTQTSVASSSSRSGQSSSQTTTQSTILLGQ